MMEKHNNIRWYRYALIIPVVATLFLVFSCQQDSTELESESIRQSHLKAELEWKEIRKLQSDLVSNYFDEHLGEPGNDDLFYQEAEAFKKVATSEELERYSELREMEKIAWKRKAAPDPDGVYTVVENMPAPEGGMKEFYQYIDQNMRYPKEAREKGVEGKVFVQFMVNKYGETTDFKVLKGTGAGCDAEAVRVLRGAPAWSPGITNGKPVSVRMVIPITFKLDDGGEYKSRPSLSLDLSDKDDIGSMGEVVVVGYGAKN